ncbi:MAG TPA: hypothetical protein VJW94_14320 [Candidatus Acidoferrum sp.]|nr:hypothetical protein [Candidatus Acidoferrum sp.]
MTHFFLKTARPIYAILFAFLIAMGAVTPLPGQEKKAPQTDGVDNTKMGAYRAIAQHAYLEFQKGDMAAAAQLARSLERVWDKGEDYGGDTALKKTHPDLFEQIDKAMDDFITPLMDYKTKTPDPARIKAALGAYLEKLKLAD